MEDTMNIAKKTVSLFLAILFLIFSFGISTYAAPAQDNTELDLDAKSVILMEAATGKVLYENNADEPLPPASVTKIMTLLLVMEAIDEGQIKLTDMVTVSENAASMGGSQVYLEPGEKMSVEELIKCVVIASANDASVALAEYVAGSEEGFIRKMNERAKQLGMKNTYFENTTGLDDTTTKHLTSARDIAIMSRELIKYDVIKKYAKIWMDSIRNGAFGLTNTNRLIRFYEGANGLKTGSTSKAGFCISATALRDGMQLIAVVMGSPNRDTRNNCAKKLLDYGFSNYAYANYKPKDLTPLYVKGGVTNSCKVSTKHFDAVVPKGTLSKIEEKIELPESLAAPVEAGDVVGKVTYLLNGEKIGEADIVATESIKKIGVWDYFKMLIQNYFII